MNFRPFCPAAALLLGLAPIGGWASDALEGLPVSFGNLPAAAQKAIQLHSSGGKIEEILRVSEACEVLFDVELIVNQQSRSLTVNEHGDLLEMEIPLSAAPSAVKKAIHAHAGKNKVVNVTKCLTDGENTFEAVIMRAGKERTLVFSASGHLEEEEVGLMEAPEKVRKAVQQIARGKPVEDLYKVMDEGETNFEIEIGTDEHPHTVTFDVKGELVAEEQSVPASILPPAVWKTYRDSAGVVQPCRVSKLTQDGVTSFLIDFVKGNQRQTMSLGADGKLID
jgi:hypothetical protein